MERSYKKFFLTSLAVFILDQLTKCILSKVVVPGQNIILIPGFLNLVHVHNSGVAFGLFASHGLGVRIFFSLVNLWACIVLFFLVRRGSKYMPFCAGLIAGGALGNFIDRAFKGEVFDFIDLHIGIYHWPSFNVADSAITLGVLGLLFLALKEGG